MSDGEIRLTRQSEAILEKLRKHSSDPDGLTEAEIARVRSNFMREDNTLKAVLFLYNTVIKLAGLLAALSAIWFFFVRGGK